MLDVVEMAARILAELEEAGEDSAQTLLITCLDTITGDQSEIDTFKEALARLCSDDRIRMSLERALEIGLVDLTKEDSLALIQRLHEILIYNKDAANWESTLDIGPPYRGNFPEVTLTTSGLAQARALLEQRGWQWWRSAT